MKRISLGKSGKYALVDDEDYFYVNQFKWSYSSKGYARRQKTFYEKWKAIWMHRFVWYLHYGVPEEGYVIDHIDRNPLNNCISNLRLATIQENAMNQSKYKNNTSGYKGICKTIINKGTKWPKECWLAQVGFKNERYRKYYPYTDEGLKQAKEWVINKRKELFGEFNPDEN